MQDETRERIDRDGRLPEGGACDNACDNEPGPLSHESGAATDHAATSHAGQPTHHHHSHAAHSSHAGGHHLLQLDDVSIGFERYAGRRSLAARETRFVVEHLSLSIHQGEILALVGASGSGKTLIADAVMGLFAANSVVTGRVWFDGELMDERALARLRGRQIAFVPQSVEALDPLQRVGRQIERLARGLSKREAATRRRELFARYGLGEDAARRYPFELSGGMARRVLLAGALMNRPRVIVADEPTPGLDLELAVRAMDDLRAFADDGGGVLLITHDIELALRVADRIAVFQDGTVVEETAVANFAAPDLLRHPFSRALWHALPERPKGRGKWAEPLKVPPIYPVPLGALEARGVSFAFGAHRVIDGLALAVAPGERVALRAPSGTGKTTLCRILAGYLQPQTGSVTVDGAPLPRRGASPVQLVAQHPERMLDPAITLRASLREATVRPEDAAALDAWERRPHAAGELGAFDDAAPTSADDGFASILDALGLQPAWLDRFPAELSGGELQRCCIARALAARPRYLVCDEISTMLDAVTQAQLWHFLIGYTQANGIGMVLVSHSDALLDLVATRVVDLPNASNAPSV